VFIFSELVEDGKPHPITGIDEADANTYTRVDAHTIKVTRLKDGKVVQTATWVVSQDGKTLTANITGTNANGREVNNIALFEKQ
jgi:VCBS repeat-containing protein